MKYKDTLHMPQTNFEMKANLTTKEPEIQKQWEKNKIVVSRWEKLKNNKKFIIHDGPPYANGDLHVGHALNKILKDFIVRFYQQKGIFSELICGWDTHGLPIENAVIAKGIDRKKTTLLEFRKNCRQYALEQVNNQAKQFSQLGLFTDFNNKYITLDFKYEMVQIELLKKMINQDLLYRKLKPIYWSPSSETALAEAEIEYQELSAPSVYVAFDIIKGNSLVSTDSTFLIWTTTPWTLPMNQLLAVGKNIIYVQIEVNNQKYIIAKDLLSDLSKLFEWTNVNIIKEMLGQNLIGLVTQNPLYSNRTSPVVIGHHVTTLSGTGIVHIAPGFGIDDYLIGQEHGIEIFAPINDDGTFNKKINDADLNGIFYDDANKIITTKLTENNKLLKLKFVKHRYPIDWRTKKPVIYRATNQWFINIEVLKTTLLNKLEKVNFFPEWGKKRMLEMIANREDWCISRQRVWGVPIIAFFDENKQPQYNNELIEHVENLFLQEKTTDIWFSWTTDQLLPKKYQNKNWTKETDIMDVWFDSGVSNLVLQKNYHVNFPVDLYLEGMDQFRGWFNSSLITSIIGNKIAPYKNVIAHGFVNDEKGRKMSKSLGNTILPAEIIQQYGSDILRLWVASVDYQEDVKIGPEILKQISESYRKIRNTLRFIVGNLFDFNVATDIVTNLADVDKYLLSMIKDNQQKINQAFEQYNFNMAYNLINNLINNTLSKFYLDFIKDILYVEDSQSLRRKQVQTTIYYILRILMDILKPILPHTIEEVHQYYDYPDKEISVHLEENFNYSIPISSELKELWTKVLQVREEVNKQLENVREEKIIGKSLEAHVYLSFNSEFAKLKNISDLHQIFIVSDVTIEKETIKDSIETFFGTIKITPKKGEKCQRCWLIYDKLMPNEEICQRCYNVLYLKH